MKGDKFEELCDDEWQILKYFFLGSWKEEGKVNLKNHNLLMLNILQILAKILFLARTDELYPFLLLTSIFCLDQR